MPPCPTCGLELSEAVADCPRCAEESASPHRCERCGEEYRGEEGCPVCGALHQPAQCEAHADRAAVGRCVLCGRAVCTECGGDDRRPTLCERHRSVTVIEGWAQVYSAKSEFEAQLLRENLRAEGIDAQVFSQRDNIFSVDLGELNIVRLLVPVWEYQQALEVIRDHMDMEGEVAFACPECGEAYELGSRECVGCGAPLA